MGVFPLKNFFCRMVVQLQSTCMIGFFVMYIACLVGNPATAQCAGKIAGFIASIPQVIVAGLLVFMWTLLAALGLSNLRYSETGSSRNVLIVGLSLFLSLSIPAYFQQYNATPVAGVPAYFQQYTLTAHGPVHTRFTNVIVSSFNLLVLEFSLYIFGFVYALSSTNILA